MNLEIQNRKGKLKLNDGVHKESADKLIEELDRMYGPSAVSAGLSIGDVVCSAADALEGVEVEINSPGGSVFEGHRIYNALREMAGRGVPITTTVNGLAASMGSVILMAGDERRMTKGSRIMIHEASTMAWGDARTLRKSADLLEGISAEIAQIYSERTGGDESELRNLMLAETWMTADEAKNLGFVHSVVGEKKQDAKAEFDKGNKGMANILSKLFPGNEHAEQIEAQLQELDALRADLTAAQGRIDELVNLEVEKAAIAAELAEVKGEIETKDAKIKELEESAVTVENRSKVLAAELLAATGHPAPVAVEENGETLSILDQFNNLKGADATAFYKKNRKAILDAQSKLSH